MIPTFWDKAMEWAVLTIWFGVIVGGSIYWGWWFGIAFPLGWSIVGGLMQLYRQRGKTRGWRL